MSSASHKTGQKEHHHQSAVASASAAASSLQQHHDAGGQHQQLGAVGKEPALVRLKRIKRQVASTRTIPQPSSSSSNLKYIDTVDRKPDKFDLRPVDLTEGRTPATPLGSFHEFGGGRVHTEMLRRLEDANRKLSQYGGVKGLSSKTNEIAELRKGHHIQDGGRHRLAGTGSYAHHKHEQDKLDSTAAVVAAVRQQNRKNKHQKNRSEFALKGTKSRNYALVPRLRPGDRIEESESALVSGRGRGRGHPKEKGRPLAEAKHRTRRGQRSGMTTFSSKVGSHAQGVKTELERIRRMQRDLMKEISHLEHMKKKKRRNVNERISQGQRKVSAPKRK